MENYLLIHRSILPDYFDKVIEARHMLASGEAKDVSQAVRMVGISRSTYYKYKDYILEPTELSVGKRAVISVMLSHEPGILSALLSQISSAGASVLTITQSLPIRGQANVTVSLDVGNMSQSVNELMGKLGKCPGVEKLKLLAVE